MKTKAIKDYATGGRMRPSRAKFIDKLTKEYVAPG